MGLSLFWIPWSNQRWTIPLAIREYHKPTHTDQYLQWDSHHNLSAKYSVLGTLTHRAKSVCTTPGLLDEEFQHLKEALVRCKYPRWAINKVQNKVLNGNWEEDGNAQVNNTRQDNTGPSINNSLATTTPGARPSAGHIVIPYVQGLGESIKCTCLKYSIRTHFKGNGTLKQILIKPKDKDPEEKKSGVIYCYQCSVIDCGEEYIGETSRTLGGKVPGVPQGALAYTGTQPASRTPNYHGQLQYHRQGEAGLHKINQRIYLHKGK